MADLSTNFAGIKSPNPFWLASAPPTNSGAQIQRAFDLGWGGAVWKTLSGPIINTSARLWSVDYGSARMMGLNNIELTTARPWDTNIREIKETKKKYPKNALVVSVMIESKKEAWQKAVKELNDTGCDGLRLFVLPAPQIVARDGDDLIVRDPVSRGRIGRVDVMGGGAFALYDLRPGRAI